MAHSQGYQMLRGLARQAGRPDMLRLALFAQFALFGLILGAQGVIWEAVMRRLRMSEDIFGTALLVTPLIGFGVLMSGKYTGRFSDRSRTLAGLFAIAAALLALTEATGLGMLIISRTLAGLGYGLLEGAATGAAMGWERSTGGRLLSPLYAGLSIAMVLGALAAGVILDAGWEYGAILLPLALITLLLAGVTGSLTYPAHSAGTAGGTQQVALPSGAKSGLRLLLWLCLLATAGEALAGSWSVIHLHGLGTDALVAGATFALFNIAMVIGRLGNNALVAWLSPRVAMRCAALGVVIAAAALTQGTIVAAVAGFAVLGLAVAGVVPLALSITAERSPEHAAGGHHAILAVTFLSFIVAPPVAGWLTNLLALQQVLVLGLLVVGGAMLVLTRRTSWRVLEVHNHQSH